jgi:GDP-D-mannose dehydratase
MKKALITGITGQDGAYLAEFYSIKAMKYMVLKEGHLYLIPKELIIFTKIHIFLIDICIYIMAICRIVPT